MSMTVWGHEQIRNAVIESLLTKQDNDTARSMFEHMVEQGHIGFESISRLEEQLSISQAESPRYKLISDIIDMVLISTDEPAKLTNDNILNRKVFEYQELVEHCKQLKAELIDSLYEQTDQVVEQCISEYKCCLPSSVFKTI